MGKEFICIVMDKFMMGWFRMAWCKEKDFITTITAMLTTVEPGIKDSNMETACTSALNKYMKVSGSMDNVQVEDTMTINSPRRYTQEIS